MSILGTLIARSTPEESKTLLDKTVADLVQMRRMKPLGLFDLELRALTSKLSPFHQRAKVLKEGWCAYGIFTLESIAVTGLLKKGGGAS